MRDFGMKLGGFMRADGNGASEIDEEMVDMSIARNDQN